MAEIKASEQNLNSVFSNDYFFEIPMYQRPYSWEEEQVSALLDDLLKAKERDDKSPYFLGSIVLVKNESSPQSDVIDGQQRLTTISMLFCVLRELAEGNIKNSLDSRVRETGDILEGTKDRFRVRLRERDRKFFQEKVQESGALAQFLEMDKANFSDSQERIYENAKYLYREMSELDEKERTDFAIYVGQQCYLVVVATSDVSSAYRIFSVMNDRGLDLSPTDILKADLIGKIADNEQQAYGDKWEKIEEDLGRDDFRDLFSHIRMIHLQTKQQRTLQEEFQDSPKLLKGITSESAKVFIDEVIQPYADVFDVVSRASYESSSGSEKVNAYLKHLVRLDNFDWIPPAMSFFRRNLHNREALIRFTKDLERLAYGLFIRRANINERANRYAEVLQAIEQDENLWQDNGPLQLKSGEKIEILSALNGQIYLQTRVRLPLLLRLDSLLADAGASYDRPVISVEHVLPQNPGQSSQWLEWFPDANERGNWTHRLANLVLLSWRKNTSASNREFDHKKQTYFQRKGTTPFVLTTQVVNEPQWTREVLERRQRDLIGALKKEWRLD